MSRDWDWTWEHWRELSDEERATVHREIAEETERVGKAFVVACEQAAKAMREFARATTS